MNSQRFQLHFERAIVGEPNFYDVDYQALQLDQERKAKWKDIEAEPAFTPIYNQCRVFTMTSVQRLFDLYKSVEYVVKAGIPGAIVECGVWRGGSMMLVARTLNAMSEQGRRLILFDTFEGHPQVQAREENRDIFGNAGWKDVKPGWGAVPESEVRESMRSTGYPEEQVTLVKGLVENTLAGAMAEVPEVAIARLDTDWYESALVELEVLWPKLSVGGLLIVDDYGHYKGQRKAVDEYFADKPVKLTRVDYSCRVAQRIK